MVGRKPFPKKIVLGFLMLLTSGSLARQAPEEEYGGAVPQANISTPAPTPTQSRAPRPPLHPSVAIWRTLRELKPGSDEIPSEVKKLLGKTTEVAGFAIMNELAYDPNGAPKMSEFLITPVPGGCIHVPPPPPNFILHVKLPPGKSTALSFAPLWLKGKITLPKGQSNRKYYSYEMVPVEIEDYYQHIGKP
jgi:uncharacterized protein